VRRTPCLWLALAALATGCGGAPAPEAQHASAPSVAPPPAPASLTIDRDPAAVARIHRDIAYLASPELAGRGTGDAGARLAADFVARRFAELGLEPLGDTPQGKRSFLQRFDARVGVKTEPPALSVGGKAAPAGVLTADGSASGAAAGKPVFVGYGISAPALAWDDYGKADVKGKIVVVLDGAPTLDAKAHRPDALRDFRSERYKIRSARERNAAGVVLVRLESGAAPPPSDASSMGLPAVVIGRDAAKQLFPGVGFDDAKLWQPKAPAPPRPVPGGREVSLTTRLSPIQAEAWNVVGLLPARAGSQKASEHVVVGAHYDHLGHGGTASSRAPDSRDAHLGADDNASGTALMLEVARRIAALPRRPDRSLVFVAFGAEEIGVIGSRRFVEQPPIPMSSIVAMINADMVGRLRDNQLVVDGVGTASAWPSLVERASRGLGLAIKAGAEGFGASDHTTFATARVPVTFLFTGVHEDYHRPSDTVDKINAEGEERITTLAARLALSVAQAPDRLAFVDVPSDPHKGGRGGFRVALGTMPDYAYQGKGVRLTGARADSAASRAGAKPGDVILKLGAHEITNIHDYMFALGELEPGRAVVLEVERDGQRIKLSVIPAPGR
jgi:Zn-dependent M28 family amino/carboxypeptidase